MFFGLCSWPGDFNVEARDYARPACGAAVTVVPDFAVDEFLDDYVSGYACFGVGEGKDETDGGKGDWFFD